MKYNVVIRSRGFMFAIGTRARGSSCGRSLWMVGGSVCSPAFNTVDSESYGCARSTRTVGSEKWLATSAASRSSAGSLWHGMRTPTVAPGAAS